MNPTTKFECMLVAIFAIVLLLVRPLGTYMANVMEGKGTAVRLGKGFEQLLYRVCGIDSRQEMSWSRYACALLLFNTLGALVLYLLQRLQHLLPLNPQAMTAVSADSSFNTAISFVTNTNWQGYSGESTLGYLVQMSGLAVQNFASAATGMGVAIAMIRGFARHTTQAIGNFWVDLVRSALYILLPLSVILAAFLVGQGVIQNFSAYQHVATLEATTQTQTLPMGPVASQEAIKELGTNGGGFYNANSAHPFENPTPLSNLLEIVALLLIPFALTHTFGRMVGDTRQGWAVLIAMIVLLAAMMSVGFVSEQGGNPLLAQLHVDQGASALQAGGNMEGKEVRFGVANSALFATITTDASCGAINSWHDSFTPLGGMIPLLNIMLGEIIFGGVGAGIYGMLVMIVLTVFIAGLMVGRTPEYLGKKVESKDVKMAMLYVLIFAVSILCYSAWSSIAPYGASKVGNGGPHGLSEIVYAFTSATGNNGSAFGGITVNNYWYNTTLGLAMLIGRFLMIIPMMAIAGNLAAKKIVPPSAGTFPVYTPLFVMLLIGVILIVGALTFFPVLSLGPIVEHYLMNAGTTF